MAQLDTTQSMQQTSIGRLYRYGDDWIPSVTTILEYSKPAEQKNFLLNFKKNNPEYIDMAINGGIILHDAIEGYLKTKKEPTHLQTVEHSHEGTKLDLWKAFETVRPLLDSLEVLYIEQPLLFLQEGYAGTLDCIAIQQNTLYLIDWKTSVRYKEKVVWNSYPAQLAAYIQAANSLLDLPEKIDQGKIVKIYQSGIHQPHVYTLTPEKYLKQLAKFNKHKQNYYSLLKYLIRTNQL